MRHPRYHGGSGAALRKLASHPATRPRSGALERLFVYGSLAPGAPNHHVLASVSGTWSRATVRGQLLNEGWGAGLGFPAFVPDGTGEVAGWIFSSAVLSNHWPRLDAFEGSDYCRQTVRATLEGGESLDAFVYAANNV